MRATLAAEIASLRSGEPVSHAAPCVRSRVLFEKSRRILVGEERASKRLPAHVLGFVPRLDTVGPAPVYRRARSRPSGATVPPHRSTLRLSACRVLFARREFVRIAVLAGGSGKRFWPASRVKQPKQVLSIVGGRPLLAAAFDRALLAASAGDVFVVTQEPQADAVRACLPQLPAAHLVIEPEGRDTAGAVTLGAAWALAHRASAAEDPVVATTPSDHVIDPAPAFAAALRTAAQRAESSGAVVMIGVKPTYPATAYGYLRRGPIVGDVGGTPVLRVAEFREKPDVWAAQAMVESGNFFWNAGVFVFRTSVLRAALQRSLPEHARALDPLADAIRKGDMAALARTYGSLPRISIDVGVMEKERTNEVVPLDARWDDVGSWSALERHVPKDVHGNAVIGTFVPLRSSNNVVVSSGDHLIAAVGVDDLVIVHTPDATLVCRKSYAESVKQLVDEVRRLGHDRVL
jgi:mannose-1-phosphate guanylyltransferase